MSADLIMQAVCEAASSTPDSIRSKFRGDGLPDARKVLCMMLDEITDMNRKQIALFVGYGEQSMAGKSIDACQNITKWNNPRLFELINKARALYDAKKAAQGASMTLADVRAMVADRIQRGPTSFTASELSAIHAALHRLP